MMEPIALWEITPGRYLDGTNTMRAPIPPPTHRALTRADFDAREAEYRDAEVLMARMREVVAAATARADALAALLKEAREILDAYGGRDDLKLRDRIDAELEVKK